MARNQELPESQTVIRGNSTGSGGTRNQQGGHVAKSNQLIPMNLWKRRVTSGIGQTWGTDPSGKLEFPATRHKVLPDYDRKVNEGPSLLPATAAQSPSAIFEFAPLPDYKNLNFLAKKDRFLQSLG
ncbi:MAG: hypothetical protein O3C21_13845 [Verrucomicrobia bacterium]|nr:hypothetical protein [Verrucomicrobiota bacterium]